MQLRRSHLTTAWLLPLAAVSVVLGALAQEDDGRLLDVSAALLRTIVLVVAWVRLRGRSRLPGTQFQVWANLSRAVLAIAACACVDLASVVSGRGATAAQVFVTAVGLAGFLLVYRALLHWNRVGGSVTAAGEWVNGLCSMLAAAGLGNLLVASWTGGTWNGWTWWQLQVWLLPVCGLAVVLATLLTVAQLSGFLDDRRVLVLSTGGVLVLLASCVSAADGAFPVEGTAVLTGAPLTAVLMVWCSQTTGPVVTPRSVSQVGITIGALVVGTSAIVVLVLSTRLAPALSLGAVVYAGVALLGVAWRQVLVVREMTGLLTSRRQALTDDLTDLPNRRAFVERLGDGFAGVLLVLDLDGFQAVNDRHGHHGGDELLREVARRWSVILPADAFLARLGGDEFAVLVPGAGVANGRALAVAFAETLELLDVPGGWRPAVSTGIAPGEGRSAAEVVRRADAALFLAKTTGAGVSVYDDVADRAVRERTRLTEELRAAVTGRLEEFVAHYQPQVRRVDGALTGVEALVRWNHPRLGTLAPDAFMDLVEAGGWMPVLTDHLLRSAVAQQQYWATRGVDVRVSVNLSAEFLDHPHLIPTLDELDPSDRLVIEVTETALMSDPASALVACEEIVRRGIGLSIDDYGTGYSTMSYLAVLPATELKIDRSFVVQLTDPRIRAIVAATVELAHSLGMHVVAEGVETPDHLAAVGELDVDVTQGFLHAAPLTADDLEHWARDLRGTPQTSGTQNVAVSMTNRYRTSEARTRS